jgi:quercetin dioxygenase-like cupin family protein
MGLILGVAGRMLVPLKGGHSMAQTKAQKVTHADPVKVDSKHYTVELENEKVRVLRIKYGPHEKSKMHGHPASVTVFLNDCEARFTYPDGKTENIKAKAGQVVFFPAFEHEPENLGDKPFEVIGIELKG